MKILSSLDGASRVVQDSDNRFVSDAEKVEWNGKADVETTLNNTSDYAKLLAMSIALGG